ncbi:MAG: hypothetical protein ACOX4V_03725 [Anaerovoracaceae bacterium]|jgi:hypothetical protein
MNKKLKMGVGIGGSSIIMIIVVLSLTTLSVLSLMTANSDWKLTKRTVQAVTDYYNADNQAEEILASADANLKNGNPSATNTFEILVSDKQKLVMKLEPKGSSYSVISRKLVPLSQWEYEKYQTQFGDVIIE